MLTAAIAAPKISFETFAMTSSLRVGKHAASPQIPSHLLEVQSRTPCEARRIAATRNCRLLLQTELLQLTCDNHSTG
jgi:hypothetical protein